MLNKDNILDFIILIFLILVFLIQVFSLGTNRQILSIMKEKNRQEIVDKKEMESLVRYSDCDDVAIKRLSVADYPARCLK